MHVSTKTRVLQDKAGALKSVAKIEDRSDRIEKCDKQDRSDSTEKLGWEVVGNLSLSTTKDYIRVKNRLQSVS